MTIKEAIKTLDDARRVALLFKDTEVVAAVELGIEALKLVQRLRADGGFLSPRPLPGETKD